MSSGTRTGRRRRVSDGVSNQPSGLLLSPRVPISRNVYRSNNALYFLTHLINKTQTTQGRSPEHLSVFYAAAFSYFSASQLLQDIGDLIVGVALLQQFAADGRIAPALPVETGGAVRYDGAASGRQH